MSPKCQHCGAHVSEDFAKVFGDRDDEVHRCLECDSGMAVRQGTAAGREHRLPPEVRRGRSDRVSTRGGEVEEVAVDE